MSTPIEDRVRDLLADRTARVAPPVGWEERVVSAGRRRRTQRRVTVGAAVAVALVMLAVVVVRPPSILGIEPVGPFRTGRPAINPGDLPAGKETSHLYATGQKDSPVTVISGDLSWVPYTQVGMLRNAGDGIVAVLTWGSGPLVYRGTSGEVKTLQSPAPAGGVAVSPDGTQVAWMSSEGSSTRLGTLKLAELPSARVTASMPVTQADLPGRGTPIVMGFLGGNVVLGYEGAQWPSVWDPDAERIEPVRGQPEVAGRLLDLYEDSGVMLLMTSKGCIRPSSLTVSASSVGWPASVCGLDPASEVRISPDGRRFAGFQPDGETVWVRDLRTGRLVWEQRFKLGINLGESFADRRIVSGLRLSQLEWESPDALLVTYGSPNDLDAEVADMMRCAAGAPACERVPTAAGERVTVLGQ